MAATSLCYTSRLRPLKLKISIHTNRLARTRKAEGRSPAEFLPVSDLARSRSACGQGWASPESRTSQRMKVANVAQLYLADTCTACPQAFGKPAVSPCTAWGGGSRYLESSFMCSGCSWTYPARYYCSCSQSPDLASPHRVLESSWHLEDATAIATEYDHTSHRTRRASGLRACRGAVKAHTPCGPFIPHPQCSSLGHRRKLSQNGPWLALRCKSKKLSAFVGVTSVLFQTPP